MTARYPLQALALATGLSEAALGRLTGLSGTSLVKARELGLVEKAADRCAVRAGLHPGLVWKDWLAELEVSCPECEERFVPSRSGHKFCTIACGKRQRGREAKRLRYRTDPVFAERERAQARAYHAECARAEMFRHRRWRAANPERAQATARAYYLANRDRILAGQRVRDARRRAA